MPIAYGVARASDDSALRARRGWDRTPNTSVMGSALPSVTMVILVAARAVSGGS
ncbi:hypothetical protein ACWDBW_18460 [Streptomyces sp. NPDC001107]